MKHNVLLVDDEPRVLEALRRYLRPYRESWDVTIETSGAAALARMAEGPFDVIVTDMRMPGMDGARLLEIVKERHPATMRIVLSGQTDSEASLRTIPVAHQFLSKPTDPEILLEQLRRLALTRDAIVDPKVRAALGGIDVLPSVRATCGELGRLLSDPDVSPKAIAQVVEGEPALAAKLLQLVNSAFFSIRRQILDVSEAIAYLGTDLVKSIFASIAITSDLPIRAARFDRSAFAVRSFAVGQMARRIGREMPTVKLCFAAGLLHDIGRLAIASGLPDVFDDLWERAAESGRSFDDEAELAGYPSTTIGAALLDLWGIPFAIVEAILRFRHAASETAAELGTADVLYLAHRLVDDAHAFESAEEQRYLARLGVTSRIADWATEAAAVRAAA